MSSIKLEKFSTSCGGILGDAPIHSRMDTFDEIEAIRRDLSLRIGDFMELINRHPTLYSKWRNGEAQPNEETLRMIEKVAGGKFQFEGGEVIGFKKNTMEPIDHVSQSSNVVSEREATLWPTLHSLSIGADDVITMYAKDATDNNLPPWEELNKAEQDYVMSKYSLIFEKLRTMYSELRLDCLRQMSTRLERKVPSSDDSHKGN